ncbi:hypothetical protein CFP65_1517 [Kitasatospora sp. MMS16-BH015]|uniref:FAD-dependent monooxygenase n=1 Tax=Kitasatospora sp. MMS16-BH015 TaxID=2018025 RepID=UPI000CA32757|nr:FAD-dependent monooxygenase [Kitasatospora sp. MMS16-BH015]AUG76409.1 hypothetical protein CFP65_1517 [Kitasatospora sp. MMS16-BH015]
MTALKTPVLIVGGGPVGLTLSLLLSGYGVDHLLVEARRTVSPHPKARGVSARSMEVFRRLGLAAEVRRAGLPADQVRFYRGRDLVDPEFVRTGAPEQPDGEPVTPTPGLICSQDALEPVLLRRATALAGARIRFGTRLLSYREEGDGVGAVLADAGTGARQTVRADWLIGCDGAASSVRAGAGIALEGPTGLGRYLSVRLEAPLGAVVADRASASYFLTVPGRGGFLAVDNDRQWIYQCPLGPEAQPPTDPAELAGLVRTAAGLPELAVTIVSTLVWRMDARLAEAYRRSRVLLAGDAAHVVPPTGGHGMNTGIGDADNLAWKLAAVVAGGADQALLDTYEAERRPVARQVIEVSTANAANRAGYRIDDELLLTPVYRSAAVLPAEAPDSAAEAPGGTEAATTLDPTGYRPACRPGARLPHLPLADGASTLDLVGPGFTLIAPGAVAAPGVRAVDPADWPAAARARWRRLPGGREAVLVRPDGHLAWCGAAPGGSPDGSAAALRELSSAMAGVLSRTRTGDDQRA